MRAAIRVKPGASRTFVGGSYAAPDGPALVVAVNSPAVEGKATAAAIKALAKALGVRTADVELVSGHTSRTKVVDVPDSCRARWAELLA